MAKQLWHRKVCANQAKFCGIHCCNQIYANVIKCHQMSYFSIRCELEGHAVSPDTGLDIEIVETIDYQDFFEVFFSNCPNAPMSSLIPSSLMDHILNCHSFPQDHHHPEVHHDADCQGAPWRAILPAGAVLGLRRKDHGQEASTSSWRRWVSGTECLDGE